MTLRFLDIVLLTLFPIFIAGGQVLFKITSAPAKGKSLVAALPIFFTQPAFYAALVVYGSGTLFWLWLLSRYPMTLAYPFAAVALVAVPLFDVLFFGARTNAMYWLGLALIVAGVLIVTRAQGQQ